MPRAVTVWHCDLCNRSYKTETKAAECESSHYKVIGIEDYMYAWDGLYPRHIIVNIEANGKVEQVAYFSTKNEEEEK